MNETTARVARAIKLMSVRGTLLGTVTVPERWAEAIDKGEEMKFWIGQPTPLVSFGDWARSKDIVPLPEVGHLIPSRWQRGAVELWGCSLEQFEQTPGCSFAPSAAYIRSLIADA